MVYTLLLSLTWNLDSWLLVYFYNFLFVLCFKFLCWLLVCWLLLVYCWLCLHCFCLHCVIVGFCLLFGFLLNFAAGSCVCFCDWFVRCTLFCCFCLLLFTLYAWFWFGCLGFVWLDKFCGDCGLWLITCLFCYWLGFRMGGYMWYFLLQVGFCTNLFYYFIACLQFGYVVLVFVDWIYVVFLYCLRLVCFAVVAY